MPENRLVADIGIVFTLDGRRLTLRYRALPISAWSELYNELGLEPRSLSERVATGSPVVAAAVIWLERKQRERRLTWAEVRRELERAETDFEIVDLLIEGVSQLEDTEDSEDATPADPPTTPATD